MTRQEELEKVKEIIKENVEEEDIDCGLFSTRNIAGDIMDTLFSGQYFTLDVCYFWAYFELFGTTKEEFEDVENYYHNIGGI